ncbi:MAG: UDP-glucose 4-epimerase GalE [Flavobacteriales bacterium]|nr:UDP-glucose 4-epimerase GalE [Flavobacteriales bacterium]
MKKIIVTGGAGYIGSHTVVELYKSGFTPIIIDNLCNSSIKNIEGISKVLRQEIKWHNVDCTNQKSIDLVFEKEKNIEGVIHFAAYKSVEESVKEPQKYHENNIGSLEVILESMRKNNVKNIIFSSSCTVYGSPDILPVTEDTPFKKAESPYGETKQLCEKLLEKDSCNSISLRYFNPIGSHSSSLIGDCSTDKPTNLVPILTEVAIGKREQITVFGYDYNTPDGSCIRDYIHVVDLANSHVKALNYLIENSGKHAFNVGTGIGISVLEAIQSFEQANNLKINYKVGERRDGDIEQIFSDGTQIKEKLNWEANQTLKQAMIDAWNWEKTK